MGKIVLNYHDSLLTDEDIHLISGCNWFNDKLIGFAFEYFENDVFANFQQAAFINPGVSQFIKLCSDSAEVGIFLEPLKLKEKQFIFLAVNDNEEAQSTGGSHWSLLCYKRPSNKFYHYDSSRCQNREAAKLLAKQISSFVSGKRFSEEMWEECDTPQQSNGYDCGVYVIVVTEYLCKALLKEEEKIENVTNIKPADVSNYRQKLKNIIESLASTS